MNTSKFELFKVTSPFPFNSSKQIKNIISIFLGMLFLLQLTNNAFAQTEESEIIKVNTEAGQISLAIDQIKPEPFKIELTDNGINVENIFYESPKDSPLQVVIIVVMNPHLEKSKINQTELLAEIGKLKRNKQSFNLLGINIVQDSKNLSNKLKLETISNTSRFDDINGAVNDGVSTLQRTSGLRKSILVLTNEVESLPENIIEKTNQMLGKSSAMIYLMSVNERGLLKDPQTRKTDKNHCQIKH